MWADCVQSESMGNLQADVTLIWLEYWSCSKELRGKQVIWIINMFNVYFINEANMYLFWKWREKLASNKNKEES